MKEMTIKSNGKGVVKDVTKENIKDYTVITQRVNIISFRFACQVGVDHFTYFTDGAVLYKNNKPVGEQNGLDAFVDFVYDDLFKEK